jgi:hypothetical protein
MKVLLRHRETGFYFAGGRLWVAESCRARDLKRVDLATRISRQRPLAESEIVLAYDDFGLRSRFGRPRGSAPDLRE